MASLTQLSSEVNDLIGSSLEEIFNKAEGSRLEEATEQICTAMKYDKKMVLAWFREPEDFFTNGDKVTILADIFIHFNKCDFTTPARRFAYAKMFVSIRNSGQIPSFIEGFTESMSIQDIYYKSLRIHGRKRLCQQSVIKTMKRLIDYEIEENKARNEQIRQEQIEDILLNVANEKQDSPRLYQVDNFEEYYGRDSIFTYKRRMFECAERIANEALCSELTPNILDCFNEQMQNYMGAMMKRQEGDVKHLSEQLVKFYDMVKVVCDLTPVRKKQTRKRKQKKKNQASSSDDEESDDEEILLTKKECQFCGKLISSVSTIDQCVECDKAGELIKSKFN